MSVAVDFEYLTVEQVARLLQVDQPTIEKWVRAGRLPAYRIADDLIRLKRQDIDRLAIPVENHGMDAEEAEHEALRKRLSIPLTPDERQAGLRAIEAARRTAKEISARHHGQPFLPSSTELIREMREERSNHIS